MAPRPALRPLSRSASPDSERYVALSTDDGVIVYPASNSKDTNTVTGDEAQPSCTCEAFVDATDPVFRCVHIDTVFGLIADPEPEPPKPAAPAPRTLRAVPVPAPPAPTPAVGADTAPSVMLLKRSVSPDGRIDSLSIEFSLPVTALSAADITANAEASLALQGAIAERFLARRKSTASAANPATKPATRPPIARPAPPPTPRPMPNPPPTVPDDAVSGTVTYAGRTKNQKVFSLSVDVDGDRYRYFGDRRKVGGILTMLGEDIAPDELWQGVALSLPCQVTLKESKDGQYTNVDRVFPASSSGGTDEDDSPF